MYSGHNGLFFSRTKVKATSKALLRSSRANGKRSSSDIQKSILQNLNYRTSETALSIYYLGRSRGQKGPQKGRPLSWPENPAAPDRCVLIYRLTDAQLLRLIRFNFHLLLVRRFVRPRVPCTCPVLFPKWIGRVTEQEQTLST